MKFPFNKTVSYNAPDGEQIGTLQAIVYNPDRRFKNGCDQEARLTFYLITDDRLVQYAVARNFCLDCAQNDELQEFLESWLGPDLEEFIDADGDIEMELLVGRKALLQIEHRPSRNGKYNNPYCLIADIAPAPADRHLDQEAA